MTPSLAFDHVSFDHLTPEGRSFSVFDNLSLDVTVGAFVAIVGPSGCGKSTLLNLAAGLATPRSGVIRIDGETLQGLNRRATYMFQQDALLPWLTGLRLRPGAWASPSLPLGRGNGWPHRAWSSRSS